MARNWGPQLNENFKFHTGLDGESFSSLRNISKSGRVTLDGFRRDSWNLSNDYITFEAKVIPPFDTPSKIFARY